MSIFGGKVGAIPRVPFSAGVEGLGFPAIFPFAKRLRFP